jgi:hypothetical protein
MLTLHHPRHQMIPPRSMISLRLGTRLQGSGWPKFVVPYPRRSQDLSQGPRTGLVRRREFDPGGYRQNPYCRYRYGAARVPKREAMAFSCDGDAVDCCSYAGGGQRLPTIIGSQAQRCGPLWKLITASTHTATSLARPSPLKIHFGGELKDGFTHISSARSIFSKALNFCRSAIAAFAVTVLPIPFARRAALTACAAVQPTAPLLWEAEGGRSRTAAARSRA